MYSIDAHGKDNLAPFDDFSNGGGYALSCTCPGHVPDASRTSPYFTVFWPRSRFHEDTKDT